MIPGAATGGDGTRSKWRCRALRSEARSDQSFTAGQRVTLNFELKLSAVQETVTVTGQSAIVDTTSAKESSTITQQALESLPVKERNYFRLMGLNSNLYNQPNSNAVYSGGGDVWSVGTLRGRNGQLFEVDDAAARPTTRIGWLCNRDDQGDPAHHEPIFCGVRWHSGSLISAVTKSGTNEFRGSGFV